MSEFLEITYLDTHNIRQTDNVNELNFRNTPFSNSDVFLAPIQDFKLLTKGQDVKRVYDLKLSLKEIDFDFLPGDTIGILPCNDCAEVTKLLIRLNIECHAERIYSLKILTGSTKKLPKHIPTSGVLKDIFTYHVDIRKPPKKLFLKTLIQFTKDIREVKELEEICSPKASEKYLELINGSARTLLGLLNRFPSCYPPIEIILEHLMPLQPRYFSISSSPLETSALHITFSVVENDDGTKGVCTGWLQKMIQNSIIDLVKIPMYFRKPNTFRLTSDLSTPIIMVATGTGLAPFKGFLDHRIISKANGGYDVHGDLILFYGCRYANRDYLYNKEIEDCLNGGVLTKLYTAFSRETENFYVQDRINENGKEFVSYILDKVSVIYVCGNAKTMVKDVKAAVIDNLVKYGNLEQSIAEECLAGLIKGNRFIVDSWT